MNPSEHQEVQMYLNAMKCSQGYLVNQIARGTSVTNNHKPTVWSADILLSKKAEMFRANTRGQRDIFIRPNSFRFILVDLDHVSGVDMRSMYQRAMNFDPCLVTETSKGNFQFHYKLPARVTENKALYVQRWVTNEVHGDHGATGNKQLHRLPGFRNRKPGRGNFVCRIVTKGYRSGGNSHFPREAYQYRPARGESANQRNGGRSRPTGAGGSTGPSRDPMSDQQIERSRLDFSHAMHTIENDRHISERDYVRQVVSYYGSRPDLSTVWSDVEQYASRTFRRAIDRQQGNNHL